MSVCSFTTSMSVGKSHGILMLVSATFHPITAAFPHLHGFYSLVSSEPPSSWPWSWLAGRALLPQDSLWWQLHFNHLRGPGPLCPPVIVLILPHFICLLFWVPYHRQSILPILCPDLVWLRTREFELNCLGYLGHAFFPSTPSPVICCLSQGLHVADCFKWVSLSGEWQHSIRFPVSAQWL